MKYANFISLLKTKKPESIRIINKVTTKLMRLRNMESPVYYVLLTAQFVSLCMRVGNEVGAGRAQLCCEG